MKPPTHDYLTRSAAGRVEVFVNDMDRPTLTADGSEWLSGRIGIGSFNDAALTNADHGINCGKAVGL